MGHGDVGGPIRLNKAQTILGFINVGNEYEAGDHMMKPGTIMAFKKEFDKYTVH